MNSTPYRATRTAIILLPILVGIAFVVLTLPTWRWLWSEWMGNEYYSHGILIPLVSGFLVFQRIRRDDTFAWRPGEGLVGGVVLLAITVGFYLYFVSQSAWYLASFAMIGLMGALLWVVGGRTAARTLVFPVAYLGFMVPLPQVDRATMPLALFTGICSGALVRFFGVDVEIVGNAVTLPNADLVIGAQCSGINSLISLTALLTLVAYLVSGPLWARLLLVFLAVPLALLGNIVRVSSLLVVARAWGADAAFVFYHDYSGIGFFIIVLILLYPLVKLLGLASLRPNVI